MIFKCTFKKREGRKGCNDMLTQYHITFNDLAREQRPTPAELRATLAEQRPTLVELKATLAEQRTTFA